MRNMCKLMGGCKGGCKGVALSLVLGTALLAVSSCAQNKPKQAEEPKKLLFAAAASLEYAFKEELVPAFESANPGIKLEGTFDSSGKLQTQIEAGLQAEVFMSAAVKQVAALKEQGRVEKAAGLLENKLVLIVPAGSDKLKGIEDLATVSVLAVGDPASVPAGQYGKEMLENLGYWSDLESRQALSLGTNVTEVLHWVEEGSADAGLVYATDAAKSDKVKVIATAPEGSLAKPIIYPLALLKGAGKEAESFYDFLSSEESLKVFSKYGFTPYTGTVEALQ